MKTQINKTNASSQANSSSYIQIVSQLHPTYQNFLDYIDAGNKAYGQGNFKPTWKQLTCHLGKKDPRWTKRVAHTLRGYKALKIIPNGNTNIKMVKNGNVFTKSNPNTFIVDKGLLGIDFWKNTENWKSASTGSFRVDTPLSIISINYRPSFNEDSDLPYGMRANRLLFTCGFENDANSQPVARVQVPKRAKQSVARAPSEDASRGIRVGSPPTFYKKVSQVSHIKRTEDMAISRSLAQNGYVHGKSANGRIERDRQYAMSGRSEPDYDVIHLLDLM